MRLWTLHPKYLDVKGLTGLWREALLAQKVLQGGTKGYRNHPQLERFKALEDPSAALATYLVGVHEESLRRGYRFDVSKIGPGRYEGQVEETRGQLECEWEHLKAKLERRAPELLDEFLDVALPEPHPLFRIVPGPVREWERQGGK
jgi:hypothetical protein